MEFREKHIKQFEAIIDESPFTLVGTASEGEETVRKIKALKELPELVVITLMVDHGLDGVGTVKKIRQEMLGVKMILSYTIDSRMRLVEGLKAGAIERIKKPFDNNDVIKRLTKVHLTKSTDAQGGFFRNSIRLAKPLPITFAKAGLFAKKHDGRTLDISTEGCRLQATIPLKRGTEYKITLDVPNQGKFKVHGKIKSVTHDKIHSTYEAGVEFTQINEKDKEKLNLYIMDEAERV